MAWSRNIVTPLMENAVMKRFLIALVALVVIQTAGRADLIRFRSVLDPDQEVGPNTPPDGSGLPGAGYAEFIYDTDTNKIVSGTLTFGGLSAPVTNGHIHGPAAVGVQAGVIRGFPPPIPASIVSPYDLTVLTQAQIFPQNREAALLNNQTYFNIHTQQFTGGEIRGQIINGGVVPEPATLALFLVGGAGFAGARWLKRRRR